MNKSIFLAMSLPHDIICQTPVQDGICNNLILPLGGWIKGYLRFYHKGDFCNCDIDEVKPICHPLPDLTKPIEHKGEKFIPSIKLSAMEGVLDAQAFEESLMLMIKDIDHLPFCIVQKLIKWHFNLMDENEPFVDVNTLPENPYK